MLMFHQIFCGERALDSTIGFVSKFHIVILQGYSLLMSCIYEIIHAPSSPLLFTLQAMSHCGYKAMGRILEAKLSVWSNLDLIPSCSVLFLVAGIPFVEAFQFPFHQENPLQ